MKGNLIGGVAVIERDGKHLLTQQSKSKPNAGQWRHPGGKFNANEDSVAGLKREIKEEMGLDVDIDPSPVL
jgi:8-oxo-dGTP diphosphatase